MPDSLDITALQHELIQLGLEMSAMSDAVAKAKAVVEFTSDRQKRALSKAVVPFLAGESVSAAEHKARASDDYGTEFSKVAADHHQAEKVITKFKTICIRIDALRSILSTQKTLANLM